MAAAGVTHQLALIRSYAWSSDFLFDGSDEPVVGVPDVDVISVSCEAHERFFLVSADNRAYRYQFGENGAPSAIEDKIGEPTW